jgi:hypothetical protein
MRLHCASAEFTRTSQDAIQKLLLPRRQEYWLGERRCESFMNTEAAESQVIIRQSLGCQQSTQHEPSTATRVNERKVR